MVFLRVKFIIIGPALGEVKRTFLKKSGISLTALFENLEGLQSSNNPRTNAKIIISPWTKRGRKIVSKSTYKKGKHNHKKSDCDNKNLSFILSYRCKQRKPKKKFFFWQWIKYWKMCVLDCQARLLSPIFYVFFLFINADKQQ